MSDQELIQPIIAKAKAAQKQFETYTQAQVDAVVAAVSWAGYSHAETLAKLAFDHSGLGNYEDKVTKVKRKTMGTMMDLKNAKSVGVIDVDEARGVTTIAKPMGVIAALLPSTNASATPVNNAMITLKGRNAVVLAPHPKGEAACAEYVKLAQQALADVGAPVDLVQYLSLRGKDKYEGKARASALMAECDYALITAGPANVDLGYRSGTPTHGVGVGNAPVIIDDTADLESAIPKIVASKTFDNATSCSSENALVILESRYDETLAALKAHGGYLANPAEKDALQNAMWPGGRMSRAIVAQSAETIAEEAGLGDTAARAKFFIVEEDGTGADYPFSGEKLSVVLTVYRVTDFDSAVNTVNDILDFMGKGHSCGIHTINQDHIDRLAMATPVSTVLVNQPHCYNNGGGFDNGLDFTLSMGAGTWGKNDSCENLTYKHFLNFTYLARPIPEHVPTEEELWGDLARK